MKNLLLATASITAISTLASAGSLNYATGVVTEVAPPAGYIPVPVPSLFDGFYIGVSAKMLSGDAAVTYDLGGKYEEIVPTDMTSGGYGLYAGYGVVLGSGLYLGVEGNAQWFDSGDAVLVHRGCYLGSADLAAIFNLRGRIGYQTGRALIYGHVGYSVAQVSAAVSWTDGSREQRTDGTVGGIAYGVGLEYALTDNVIARVEYTINDLDDFTFSAFGRDHSASFAGQEILVGVAWQF